MYSENKKRDQDECRADEFQSCPCQHHVCHGKEDQSGPRTKWEEGCLLTKEESESREGSCSLTALRMAFQGSIWEAQGEGGEDPTSLSWEAMEAQAQGSLLSGPSIKEPCTGCRVR